MKHARFWVTGLSLAALLAAGCGLPAVPQADVGLQRSAIALQARSLPANYYAPAQGQQGQALLRSLNNIVSKHKDLGYDRARDLMFSEVDDLDNDNVVECVYIGQTIPGVVDRRTAYQNGQGLNAEHTWPQSKGAEGTAKADLHHLFPTNCDANSKRSSFPFGEVKSVKWTDNGSKLGIGASGDTVFEPRDEHKGNVARAIFYFYTVYGLNGGLDLANFRVEEETLKRWHREDPVDADERKRNDLVFAAQGNRNPFVDRPDFVSAIGKFHDPSRVRFSR